MGKPQKVAKLIEERQKIEEEHTDSEEINWLKRSKLIEEEKINREKVNWLKNGYYH